MAVAGITCLGYRGGSRWKERLVRRRETLLQTQQQPVAVALALIEGLAAFAQHLSCFQPISRSQRLPPSICLQEPRSCLDRQKPPSSSSIPVFIGSLCVRRCAAHLQSVFHALEQRSHYLICLSFSSQPHYKGSWTPLRICFCRSISEVLMMEGGAYGAGKAGGAFDPQTFIRQPHTVLRMVSWVFSIVVFGCIINEGYINKATEEEEHCIFNKNQSACNYGVTVGVLAFLTCILYLAVDVHFPQISSVKDRKKTVISDIAVSGFWSFFWFVGFCFLANQWQVSDPEDNPLNEGADAARAAIAFSFFSIFTWAILAVLRLQHLKEISFQEEYSRLFPTNPQPFP